MYKIQKEFKYPIGHRLSKHAEKCKNIHGHQFKFIIGIKGYKLNYNDMLIDFSDIKEIAKNHLDKFDHSLILNSNDQSIDTLTNSTERVIKFEQDPTAEVLSRYVFYKIKKELNEREYRNVVMDFVTVYENDESSVSFSET